MEATSSNKHNAPLSATQALEQLKSKLSQPLIYRGITQRMIEDAKQELDGHSSTKRTKYIQYLSKVRIVRGPDCATLCAIGLGQTKIAHMSRANLVSLLSLLEMIDTMVRSNKELRRIVPSEWRDTQVPDGPAKRSSAGYYSYNFVHDVNMQSEPVWLSTRLLQFLELSPLRALERRELLKGTEAIGMKVPRTGIEDIILILEIGSAQDIVKALFPKRALCLTCCKLKNNLITWVLTLKVRTIVYLKALLLSPYLRAFVGNHIHQGIDESQLRMWEVKMQRLEMTDCVELELRDETSSHGRLKLRIGHQVGLPLTNQLYA